MTSQQTLRTVACLVVVGLTAAVPGAAQQDKCTGEKQSWPSGTTTDKFIVCDLNCGEINQKLQKTAAGALEFCRRKSAGFCRLPCAPTQGQCRIVKGAVTDKADVMVKSCKEVRPRKPCDPDDPKKTEHEVVLELKHKGMLVCTCGCQ